MEGTDSSTSYSLMVKVGSSGALTLAERIPVYLNLFTMALAVEYFMPSILEAL